MLILTLLIPSLSLTAAARSLSFINRHLGKIYGGLLGWHATRQFYEAQQECVEIDAVAQQSLLTMTAAEDEKAAAFKRIIEDMGITPPVIALSNYCPKGTAGMVTMNTILMSSELSDILPSPLTQASTFNPSKEYEDAVFLHEAGHYVNRHIPQIFAGFFFLPAAAFCISRGIWRMLPHALLRWQPTSIATMAGTLGGLHVVATQQTAAIKILRNQQHTVLERQADAFVIMHAKNSSQLAAVVAAKGAKYMKAHRAFKQFHPGYTEQSSEKQQEIVEHAFRYSDPTHPSSLDRLRTFYQAAHEALRRERAELTKITNTQLAAQEQARIEDTEAYLRSFEKEFVQSLL